MSTVYYLKWGRLQLDMLDEYNVNPTYTTQKNNSYEKKTSKNAQSIDEIKTSTYEKKVQYIKIPFNRSKQNNTSSKSHLDKELVHIDIPEHVHNTLKNMSACFAGNLEEDIYAKEIEEQILDESKSIVEASQEIKEEKETPSEETSKASAEMKEEKGSANEEKLEESQEKKEEKELVSEETSEEKKEEKELVSEETSEEKKEEKESASEEKLEESQEKKEEKETTSEETSEASAEMKEDKGSANEEKLEESQEKKVEKESASEETSEVDNEAKETVAIVAEIKSELGIDSADKSVKKDTGGEGNMKEDIEKDYDPVEEEYNPVNEKEILEKLNPKVEVVDEYDWHEDSYYEQQKIDQLMDHYTYSNENNSSTSNYEETENNNNKGVVVENPIKDRGIKSKLKNLFRRKW